jgi:hypothetical protein
MNVSLPLRTSLFPKDMLAPLKKSLCPKELQTALKDFSLP